MNFWVPVGNDAQAAPAFAVDHDAGSPNDTQEG